MITAIIPRLVHSPSFPRNSAMRTCWHSWVWNRVPKKNYDATDHHLIRIATTDHNWVYSIKYIFKHTLVVGHHHHAPWLCQLFSRSFFERCSFASSWCRWLWRVLLTTLGTLWQTNIATENGPHIYIYIYLKYIYIYDSSIHICIYIYTDRWFTYWTWWFSSSLC
jgi:hypothetical protein